MLRFKGLAACALGLAIIAGAMGQARAEDAKEAAEAAEAGPLKAELVVKKGTYTLDPAQSGKEFREKLEAVKNGGDLPGKPPKVDLVLKITNTSEKEITLSIGGDESRITLKLEGPGAVTVANNVMMTMDFKMGSPVKLAPGKSHEIAVTSLSFGTRGISECAYWTEPGDYTLSATLTAAKGEEQVSVTSDAAKLKVVKEEKK